jgi:hypothetical protein
MTTNANKIQDEKPQQTINSPKNQIEDAKNTIKAQKLSKSTVSNLLQIGSDTTCVSFLFHNETNNLSTAVQCFIVIADFIAWCVAPLIKSQLIDDQPDIEKANCLQKFKQKIHTDLNWDRSIRSISVIGKQMGFLLAEAFADQNSEKFILEMDLYKAGSSVATSVILSLAYYVIIYNISDYNPKNHIYAILGQDSWDRYSKIAINCGITIGEIGYLISAVAQHSTNIAYSVLYLSGSLAGLLLCGISVLLILLINYLSIYKVEITAVTCTDNTQFKQQLIDLERNNKRFWCKQVFWVEHNQGKEFYQVKHGKVELIPITEQQLMQQYPLQSLNELYSAIQSNTMPKNDSTTQQLKSITSYLKNHGNLAIFATNQQKWWNRNYWRSGAALGGGIGAIIGFMLMFVVGVNWPLVCLLSLIGTLVTALIFTCYNAKLSWHYNITIPKTEVLLLSPAALTKLHKQTSTFDDKAKQRLKKNTIILSYNDLTKELFLSKYQISDSGVVSFTEQEKINCPYVDSLEFDQYFQNIDQNIGYKFYTIIESQQTHSNETTSSYDANFSKRLAEIYPNINHQIENIFFVTYMKSQLGYIIGGGILFTLFIILAINPLTLMNLFLISTVSLAISSSLGWLMGIYVTNLINNQPLFNDTAYKSLSFIEIICCNMFPGHDIGAFVGLLVGVLITVLESGLNFTNLLSSAIITFGINIGGTLGAIIMIAANLLSSYKDNNSNTEKKCWAFFSTERNKSDIMHNNLTPSLKTPALKA